MEERIKIHCVCGKVGLVERKHIGKTITCPKCGVARIKIEDPDDRPTDEDEVEPVDTRYVLQRNQKVKRIRRMMQMMTTTTTLVLIMHYKRRY